MKERIGFSPGEKLKGVKTVWESGIWKSNEQQPKVTGLPRFK